MKNRVWFFSILLVVAVVLGACGSDSEALTTGSEDTRLAGASAQSISATGNGNSAGVSVTGTGTVEANPDIAYVTAGVEIIGSDAAAIVDDAAQRMERILAAVQGAGVAEDDIHTASYNLWVNQRYDPRTGEATGEIDYHVVHTVRIAVRALDRVGVILSDAVNAGANVVNEVTFSVEDTDALVAEARRLAIADAQDRAQQIADALGVTLGRVVSASESYGWYAVPVAREAVGMGDAAAAVPMPAGSFSVSISVALVYELP